MNKELKIRFMKVIKDFLCLITRYKNFLIPQEELTNKEMSSAMPFAFNAAELYVVTINEKP